MRSTAALIALTVVAACTTSHGRSGAPEVVARPPGIGPFKEHCLAFEATDFGTISAAALRGTIRAGDAGTYEPLPMVQVAARDIESGTVAYTASTPDGTYFLGELPAGRYLVWSCLDGFDELRFELLLDPGSPVTGIDLYVPRSEGGGRREVLAIRKED